MCLKNLILCLGAFLFINFDLVYALDKSQAQNQNSADLALAIDAEKRADFEVALKILQKLVSQNEKNIKAQTLIGRVYFKLHKAEKGLEHLKKALELNVKYKPAYLELIEYYQEQNNLYELRLIYQDMIKALGETSEYVTHLCAIFYQDSLYDDAKKFCSRGIEINPKEPQNFVNLGLTYKALGDLTLAEKNLKYASQKFSTSAIAQSNYAYYFEEKKDYKEAYGLYKRALQAEPNTASYMVFVANMAFELENFEEALSLYERACKLDKSLDSHFRKATNTFRLKKNQKWLTKYEQVLEKCL